MHRKKIVAAALIAAMLLAGCGSTASGSEETAADTEESAPTETAEEMTEYVVSDVNFTEDYVTDDNNRVFYEIFVGSFSDSDGDGTGDLQGVINRLDYLNDGDPQSGKSLGVEGIWLTPVFQSKSYHKYDVDDYYTIDSAFGDMDTLKELIDLCHERNMLVILDLPINHTGTGMSWYAEFVNAHRQGLTDSEYYDFYSWYSGDETAPAGRTFAQISGTEDYYECNFSGSMPELNYDNELVRETMLDVARFYLELGVDGFRFDAAKYIYLGDNQKSAEFWDWYIGTLKEEYPDIYTVAEVWDSDSITEVYNSSTSCFDFTTAMAEGLIAETAKAGDVNKYTSYLQTYIDTLNENSSGARLTLFVANHDTDRAAGFLTISSGQMQMAANLYLLSPGSPFIYYGEEIGLRGSRGGASTDANRRLAMMWGDGDTVTDPEGADYTKQTTDTVSGMLTDENSLLTYYKRLIMIRTANPEIARGEFTALTVADSKIGGFTSTWNGATVAVLHNTTHSNEDIDLAALGLDGYTVSAYIGLGTAEISGSTLTLAAGTSVVLRSE